MQADHAGIELSGDLGDHVDAPAQGDMTGDYQDPTPGDIEASGLDEIPTQEGTLVLLDKKRGLDDNAYGELE